MPGPLIWVAAGGVLGWFIAKNWKEDQMYQCSKEIKRYHNKKVTLSGDEQDGMRGRRNVNRKRLKKGLAENGDPKPVGQRTQGSYAMKTMIQEIGNKHDIDDGVYFSVESLVGSGDADKTALNARKMVRDALDDGSFTRPPKLKKNCVRVYYEAGYHVDVPVYRTWDEEDYWGEITTHVELASADWKKSDPLAVTNWFRDAVKENSPEDDQTQMRRVVRMHKKFAHSRDSWSDKNLSGFAMSKLVHEKFVGCSGDDERSLHQTMKAIKARLDFDLSIEHPVVDEMLAESDDPKSKFFHEKLTENLKHLDILDDSGCSKSDALRAWKKVFNDDFFEYLATEEDENQKSSNSENLSPLNIGILSTGVVEEAVRKEGGGRFG